jgi:uncharacterized membrane protein YeaQ/YmgE (transglycosylase-associated protein family)
MNLTLESLVILFIVAGLTGVIAQRMVGYSHSGCLTSVAIGFIGGLIGTWAVKQFGLPVIYLLHVGTTPFPIVWAIIGAAVLVALLGLLRGRRGFLR